MTKRILTFGFAITVLSLMPATESGAQQQLGSRGGRGDPGSAKQSCPG